MRQRPVAEAYSVGVVGQEASETRLAHGTTPELLEAVNGGKAQDGNDAGKVTGAAVLGCPKHVDELLDSLDQGSAESDSVRTVR